MSRFRAETCTDALKLLTLRIKGPGKQLISHLSRTVQQTCQGKEMTEYVVQNSLSVLIPSDRPRNVGQEHKKNAQLGMDQSEKYASIS